MVRTPKPDRSPTEPLDPIRELVAALKSIAMRNIVELTPAHLENRMVFRTLPCITGELSDQPLSIRSAAAFELLKHQVGHLENNDRRRVAIVRLHLTSKDDKKYEGGASKKRLQLMHELGLGENALRTVENAMYREVAEALIHQVNLEGVYKVPSPRVGTPLSSPTLTRAPRLPTPSSVRRLKTHFIQRTAFVNELGFPHTVEERRIVEPLIQGLDYWTFENRARNNDAVVVEVVEGGRYLGVEVPEGMHGERRYQMEFNSPLRRKQEYDLCIRFSVPNGTSMTLYPAVGVDFVVETAECVCRAEFDAQYVPKVESVIASAVNWPLNEEEHIEWPVIEGVSERRFKDCRPHFGYGLMWLPRST